MFSEVWRGSVCDIHDVIETFVEVALGETNTHGGGCIRGNPGTLHDFIGCEVPFCVKTVGGGGRDGIGNCSRQEAGCCDSSEMHFVSRTDSETDGSSPVS